MVAPRLEGNGPPGLKTHANTAASIDPLDRPELAIRDALFPIRRGELHAVSGREGALGLAVDGDAAQPARIVGDAFTGPRASR